MKEELLKKLLDWANSLENVVSNQLPPFIQEISRYGCFLTVSGIMMVIVGTFSGFLMTRHDSENVQMGGVMAIVFSLIFGLMIAFGNCKCWLAPRLYLIDHLLGR